MSKQLKTKKFIERSRAIHGDKYDYSLTVYEKISNKVIIICPAHGKFEQIAQNHLNKKGCRQCYIDRKRTSNEDFIARSKIIHNNKYDYSLTKYFMIEDYVDIICPAHGKFTQKADNHLQGNGCQQCQIDNRKLPIDDFIKRSNIVHNNKFDYSLVKYNTTGDKIIIICPVHGKFEQIVSSHLRGKGCRQCSYKLFKLKDLIEEANKIHNNKYDYSLVPENMARTDKIKIICPIHGILKQTVNAHLSGTGCRKCFFEKRKTSIEDFIIKANKIHNNKYDYSKSIYKTRNEKIIIICPKHGEFLQTPHTHNNGAHCPKCSITTSAGENLCRHFFEEKYKKPFIKAKYSWLRYKNPMELDGYNPDLNLAFEYNGRQHYEIISRFKMDEIILKNQQERDRVKNNICKEKNVTLITIKEFKSFHYENIFENIKEGFEEVNLTLDENDKVIIKDILKTI